jgi:hypothetical protein
MGNIIISIDPGSSSGGIAVQDEDGRVFVDNMPDSMTGIWAYFSAFPDEGPGVECIMEDVGHSFPGNAAKASTTFARHIGHLEMSLYGSGISCQKVTPQKWMKALGTWPKDKKERKKAIQEAMQRRYPNIKVTLKVSDALGILTYYLNKGQRG